MVFVATLAVFIEVAEVGGGTFVALGANVAAPGASVFEPGYKGVDVGAASVVWIGDTMNERSSQQHNQLNSKSAHRLHLTIPAAPG